MPDERLAAAFYPWRSGAEGLRQWRARMPTADPFDPTDGREGDVQFFWPSLPVCAPPDLDAGLLRLVEAEEDLRWIAWLQATADADLPKAKALLEALQAEVPNDWADAKALPAASPNIWRSRIAELARFLIS